MVAGCGALTGWPTWLIELQSGAGPTAPAPSTTTGSSSTGAPCCPATTCAAAASLASFLAAAGESLARRGEASEYWPAYDPDTREFLAATYERFAQLGHTMTSPTRTDGRNPMPAPHRRAELRRPAAAPTRALRTVDGHRRPHRSAPRPAEPQHERK